MFFVTKLLTVLALPLGFSLFLLLGAVVFRRWWLAVVAGVILAVAGMPWVGTQLLRGLETRYPAVPVAKAGPADAIVVLGGMYGPPAPAGHVPNVGESIDRFEAGVLLQAAGVAPWLVFTGGRTPWDPRPGTEGDRSRVAAIQRGVPAERIVVTRAVVNTAEEAEAVAELGRERGWRRIVLVTTAWHLPRAAEVFRRAGVACQLFPVDFRTDPDAPVTLLDFVPSGAGLERTEMALRERYGHVVYGVPSATP